ncbi:MULTISPECIES: Na+/H+ antiporter subunit D [unclassified Ectothiorhodospira]|uniref:Na+/H+ antiporter subunit D n=1 Tax=unclassified Ectothiorhodospira TaxID=2684909 RepID=UPI001EE950DD|nr:MULTISPECIES: Na+/H+ antiporter subunit D [unclassified Ectothiorhodospira]MCG5514547.1 Na+/H+ antiporter subunit D [Ectothiorhodospira sp. 9100]MCG5518649.1 Na+/H+ antiporter subunit D [Ectothiorhodospira sp. 9905]
MRLEVALPVIIPLVFGALTLTLWRWRIAQRVVTVTGTGLMLLSALWLLAATWQDGILVMHMGNWQAPFGIVLVSDLLGAIMVLLAGISGFATAVYSLTSMSRRHEAFGYYPLLHLLLAGVNGAFLTGDIFNLYVWFEVMLVASFALLILGGERAQMEGAIKYVTLNLVSSAILLSAIGLLYGLTGTLNMADIAEKLSVAEDPGIITVIAMLFLVSFGIKAGAFPFFFWLPASYHTPQVAVSALFAALLTKVGVYALFRVFTLIFTQDVDYTHGILLWVAAATMLTGVLGAAAQYEFRRILSFHIISQIGYMIMGLALFTPLAIVGGVFYIMHHILVKANLFLVSGLVYQIKGTYELKELGGMYRSHPMLALLFLVPALSLAGMPPLSGFFAKFILIRAGVEAEAWWIVGVALVVGLLTLYSMMKIWAEVFWKAQPEEHANRSAHGSAGSGVLYLTITGMAALTVFIGLGAEPIYRLADAAAHQLLNPSLYIDAVLGERK